MGAFQISEVSRISSNGTSLNRTLSLMLQVVCRRSLRCVYDCMKLNKHDQMPFQTICVLVVWYFAGMFGQCEASLVLFGCSMFL